MRTHTLGRPMRYGSYDPTRVAELSADGDVAKLVWTEPAPPRWRKDTRARQLPGEPDLLDAAYREARALAREGSDVWITITPDGRIDGASHTVARSRTGLVKLSITGASPEDTRRWAERRLGAASWRMTGDDQQAAILR